MRSKKRIERSEQRVVKTGSGWPAAIGCWLSNEDEHPYRLKSSLLMTALSIPDQLDDGDKFAKKATGLL
jgi:hypothetical protein